MSIEANHVYQLPFNELLAGIPDGAIDLLLTDPPYGLTNCEWDNDDWLKEFWEIASAKVNPEYGLVVMTSIQPFTTDLIISNRKWFRYELIWVKNQATQFLDAKRKPMRIHENILIFSPAGYPTYNPQMREGLGYYKPNSGAKPEVYNAKRLPSESQGSRYPNTVLEFDMAVYSHGKGIFSLHPTQKPLALFQWLVRTYSNPNALIVDPFCGSGTTPLAALTEGRRYIAGDINQEWVDLTNKRLDPVFGQTIKRPNTSLTSIVPKAIKDLINAGQLSFLDESISHVD